MFSEKIFPKTLNVTIGCIFSRPPKDIWFRIIDGSYPLYGRPITSIEWCSKHKVLLSLGKCPNTMWSSPQSVVALYGELQEVMVGLTKQLTNEQIEVLKINDEQIEVLKINIDDIHSI